MNAAPLEAVSMARIGVNNMRCIIYLSFLMAIRLPSICGQHESYDSNPEDKQAKYAVSVSVNIGNTAGTARPRPFGVKFSLACVVR